MANSVAILSSAHDLTDVRTHRWTRALLDAGCDVTLYLKGDPSSAPAGARSIGATDRSGLGARLWDGVRLPWKAQEDVWILLDPELPLSCLPVAWLRRRKVVADVHEDYEKVAQDRPWAAGWKQPLVRAGCRLATGVAGRAVLTTVADEQVPPASARQRLVVPNRPSITHLPSAVPHADQPRAVYVGDIRAARGSTAMVQAIADAPAWRLDLIGPVSDAHRKELLASVPDEAAERITFHGRRPPGHTWEIVEGAQVGFALLEDTPAYRDSLPTKVVEYHAAGLALIVSPLRRMTQVVSESKAGVTVQSPAQAAAVLNNWAQDRDRLASLGEAGRSWAEASFSDEDPFDRAAAVIRAL